VNPRESIRERYVDAAGPSDVTETKPWAADPLGDGSIAAVEAIERAVTVDLIATFEPQLVCCATTDELSGLLADGNYAPFDYLPVRFGERVIGLLPLCEYRPAPPAGLTAERAMQPLDQSILITSGSGVLRYIEEAAASPCRLVLQDTRITGIVTISDLQKLAVRPALFIVVTHLELLMAAAIRACFRDRPDEDWLNLLRNRSKGVEERWQELTRSGFDIDRILATLFADKREILFALGMLGCTRSQVKREFGSIEKLRDGLAHANNYASTRESARKTIERVGLARKWIAVIQDILAKQTDADHGKSSDTAQASL
jgi:hypothetical protein